MSSSEGSTLVRSHYQTTNFIPETIGFTMGITVGLGGISYGLITRQEGRWRLAGLASTVAISVFGLVRTRQHYNKQKSNLQNCKTTSSTASQTSNHSQPPDSNKNSELEQLKEQIDQKNQLIAAYQKRIQDLETLTTQQRNNRQPPTISPGSLSMQRVISAQTPPRAPSLSRVLLDSPTEGSGTPRKLTLDDFTFTKY